MMQSMRRGVAAVVAAVALSAVVMLTIGSSSGPVGVEAVLLPAQKAFLLELRAQILWNPSQRTTLVGWMNDTSDPCDDQWTGVSCDFRAKNVRILNLQGVTDRIAFLPPSVSALTQLNGLYLNNCGLRGTLPKELGQLQQLAVIDFGLQNGPGAAFGSGVTGSIPPEWGNLTNLAVLVLANNRLTGSIPPELAQLEVTTFDVSFNQLTGTLPPLTGSFRSLVNINVRSNAGLVGNVTWLGECQYLQTVQLAFNRFDGPLQWIGQVRGLRVLDLRSNQFRSLPDVFANHPTMLVLDLSNNNFDQPLPDLPLPNLQSLYLSGNAFSGPVPLTYVQNLTSVTQMDLSNNQLTSLPPLAPGALSQMQCLWLSSNPWTAGTTLPAALSNMTQLDTLAWSNSGLTGPVPELPVNLRSLDLSSNQLSGPFPMSLLVMPFLGLSGVGCGSADMVSSTPTMTLALHDNQFGGDLPQPAFMSRDSVRAQWVYLDPANIDLSQNQWTNSPGWCATPGGLCSRRVDNSSPPGGLFGYNKWPVLFQGLFLGGGAVFVIGLITLCVCLRRRHQQRKNNAHSMGYVSAPAGKGGDGDGDAEDGDVVHPDIASLAGDVNNDVVPGEPLASPVMNNGGDSRSSGMSSPDGGSGHNSPMLGARALNRDAPLLA